MSTEITISRRTFLHASAVAAFARVPHPARRGIAAGQPGRDPSRRVTDPDFRTLALRALDAATAAGATYADVRFTSTRTRTFSPDSAARDSDVVAVGVRALVQGAWGFAATTEWTPGSVARLGQQAAVQARSTTWAGVPSITLGERPAAATGHWQTPVTRDPFTETPEAMYDLMNGIVQKASDLKVNYLVVAFTFQRQDRIFASTDGTYVTQTIFTALADTPGGDPSQFWFMVPADRKAGAGTANTNRGGAAYVVPEVSPQSGGYEVVEALGILDHLPNWVATARAVANAPVFQAMGDYDVVLDAYAMAPLLAGTCGVALEYDRAVGMEADGGGTSYLAPPPQQLGTLWGSPLVTITADRTLPSGAATVGWDDEGVAPRPQPLVQGGKLVDYETTREDAPELASWYHQRGTPVRSNACAAAESALTVPLVHPPNLVLQPGPATGSLETLVQGVAHGYAILGGMVTMDFQQRTGVGRGGVVHTIDHGRLGPVVARAAYTFKSQDLWHRLVALGGPSTMVRRGQRSAKGQPLQRTAYTVQAVAAHFQQVRLQLDTQNALVALP